MSISPQLASDIAIITQQEALLQFDHFDESMAWTLGCALREGFEQDGLAVLIEIRLCRETVFQCAMKGTAPENADWARRKRNTVEMTGRSSYVVGLLNASKGTSQQAMTGLPLRDYADFGGAFPVRVRGVGLVGVVTISGLPQREDHTRVAQALAALLGTDLNGVNLPPLIAD